MTLLIIIIGLLVLIGYSTITSHFEMALVLSVINVGIGFTFYFMYRLYNKMGGIGTVDDDILANLDENGLWKEDASPEAKKKIRESLGRSMK